MRILFFADFHLNGVPKIVGEKIDYQKSVAYDPTLELIDLLKARYANEKISFLAFLGDYVIGKNPSDDKSAAFEHIKEFVMTIEDKCSCIFDDSSNLKDRIIFIDGNHDVSRRDKEHHEDFVHYFGEYLTPFTSADTDIVRKNGAPVYDFEDLDILLACISTTENAGAHFSKINMEELNPLIEPLKGSEPDKYKKMLELLDKQQNVDIGTVTNSTINRFQKVEDMQRKTKIVLSHHPLIQMQHATGSHFETVNGPAFFDVARAKGFTFFVSGHLHEFYCVDMFSRGKNSDLPSATIVSVPSFINPGTLEQRFVELDIDNNDYICHLLTVDKIRYRIEEVDVATNGHHEFTLRQNEHTLLDFEIQELIEENKIIKNASTDRIQAASYDCALGFQYKRYDDKNKMWPDEVTLMEPAKNGNGPSTILLNPGERVLLYTHEVFTIPKDMLLQASPRASWNRRGISVDLSFFVEPGFEGTFCFPVTNNNNYPIKISAQEAIMSVTFRKLSGAVRRGWSERQPESLKRRLKKLDK